MDTTTILLLAITILAPLSSAITCYTNDDGKEIHEETNPEWKYCAFMPSENLKVFGLAADEDSMIPYDATFSQNRDVYKVLSMCLYEKYDMSRFSKNLKSEFVFRCVCNYDYCNSPSEFPHSLKRRSI